ncbi:RND transporter [Azoarcus sp. DD4]|uniref:efflux RND transporter permease subunit n=1 Tax=Azoarcus sp. DD4 TaxID=2027405 RepID=UPI00112A7FB6|nr:MMPL family transporter [Azoarcus sp. DD4]QDF98576.1 RND transporter [Azoarcus sp. DD4]
MLKTRIQAVLLFLMQPRLLRWRRSVAIIVLVYLLGGALLLRLELNNAPELYFPKDAPATVLERELRAEFPNDEFLVGLFAGDDLYSKPVLAALDRVAGRLARHPDVDRVFAVTRVDHIAGTADGFVVEPLIDSRRLDAGTADERLARVLKDRFMPGWLAARDGKALAVIVRTHKLTESRQRQSVELALYDAADAEQVRDRLEAVAGTVALDAAQMRSMLRDTVVFTPLVMTLGLLLLYWVVGRIVPVLIGAVAMGVVVVACVALMAALGQPYTLVTAMVPTLLSAYTVANLLHLYAALKRMRDAGFRRPKRVVFALQSVHTPSMFNVVTTAAGMISLVLVPIPPIQVFGLIGAVGVVVIYLVVFYLVPPLLVKFDRGPWPRRGGGFAWTKRISYALASFGIRHAGWVAGSAVVLALATVPLVLKVEAESDLLKFFNDAHPLTKSTAMVEERLVGVTALEIVVDGPGRDAFKSAKRLQLIKGLQTRVEAMPEVDRSLSMMDIIEEMNWAFNEEDEAFRRLPDDDGMLSQLLLIYDGRDLQELVNGEYQRMRILLNLNVHGANAIQGVIERIQAQIATVDAPELKWQIAGYGRLFADQEDLLVVGQLHSFLGAFGQIFVIMLLLWRSFPAAVISMLPNLAPLFFVFALMGAAGIHLDMATVLIAGVVLGITVDDTIHIFHSYLSRREQGHGVVFAIARSFEASGRAVVAISLLLVSQFLVLGTSSFVPSSHFGLLTATGLLAGQLMELLLLPALLVLWDHVRTRRKALPS